MSTRSSIYTQDVPDEANGVHAFLDMDGWLYIARERTPYEYTAGVALRPDEATLLAHAILKEFGNPDNRQRRPVEPFPVRADEFPGQVGPAREVNA